MSVVDDPTTSYDCKVPGCTNIAKQNRGPYALLCDEHKRSQAQPNGKASGYEQQIKDLLALGKKVDRAKAKVARLKKQAELAIQEAEDLELDFKAAAHTLYGGAVK